MILFIILLSPIQANAEDPEEETPIKYKINIVLQSIGEIHKQDGNFWAEVVIIIESYDERVDFRENPPQLEFMGAKDLIFDVPPSVGKNQFALTVDGVFFTKMDFHNYPFVSIPLKIIIENTYPSTSDKVVFVIDDPPFINHDMNIGGWYVVDSEMILEEWIQMDNCENPFL